jgi:lipoprotein
MKRIIVFATIVITFASCRFVSFYGLDYPNISGKIVDSNNQPVNNVKLYITDHYGKRFNDLSYFSNSEGCFFIKAYTSKKEGIGGCIAFDAHWIYVHTEKAGYKDANVHISFIKCGTDYDRVVIQNITLMTNE